MVSAKIRALLDHPVAQHPMVRKITGYSAGSVVAVVISLAAFTLVSGPPLNAGTNWATAAGFVGGAVPNYILNRRWAWRDRGGRSRRSEIALYAVVSVAFFFVSLVVTHWAKVGSLKITSNTSWQQVIVSASFLFTSALFFVLKFVLYETVVFKKARPEPVSTLYSIDESTDETTTSVKSATA
jgi:putative flippase GtrA